MRSKYSSGPSSAFFGINRTDEDREQSIIRINDLGLTRDREKMPPVTVLQCLALGQPCLASKWFNPLDKAEDDGEEEKPKKATRAKSKPKSNSEKARDLLRRGLMDVDEIAKETGLGRQTVKDLKSDLRKAGELVDDDGE